MTEEETTYETLLVDAELTKTSSTCTMVFHNEDNEEVGRFIFDGDIAKFEGKASESAWIFIEAVIQHYSEYIQDLKARIGET